MTNLTRMLPWLVLVSCGDKSAEATGTSGATEATAATDATASTGAGTDTPTGDKPTGAAASTGAASTGGADCEAPSTPIAGPEVTVTLRNTGAAAIFVGSAYQCDGALLATILGLSGPDPQPLFLDLAGAACETRCSEVVAGNCGCNDGCNPGKVIQIDPGGAFPMVWSGGFGVPFDLSPGCFGDCANPDIDGCRVEMQAPPATYQFTAEAYPELQCADCKCTANADGWCVIESPPEDHVGQPTQAATEFAYPGTTAVDLVF